MNWNDLRCFHLCPSAYRASSSAAPQDRNFLFCFSFLSSFFADDRNNMSGFSSLFNKNGSILFITDSCYVVTCRKRCNFMVFFLEIMRANFPFSNVPVACKKTYPGALCISQCIQKRWSTSFRRMNSLGVWKYSYNWFFIAKSFCEDKLMCHAAT